MTSYRFSNALAYTQEQLAEMHNVSFTGYFFPATITAEMSAGFWQVYQINAAYCVVMHDEHGAFVGLARMGVRGARGWCGGFGIAPDFRGTGVSKLLAAQMIQVAREQHLTTLQLEVLTQNAKAIKVYEGAGFVATRRLIGVQADVAALPEAAADLPAAAVDPAVFFPRLYEGQQPDWEREPASILALRTEAVALPGSDGGQSGLLFRRGGDNIQILAAFLAHDLPDAALATLLRAAAGNATSAQVFNEPEASPFLARCRNLGFTEFFSQHEMFLTL
ncbi:MAG TPA: GNAT family N-acetyltransferase [Ktedonobacterales bacterium]|nr:GNAT family N-acetyltransferase [Ktedonobacterales bacterium]